jgi:Cu/Ag efflux protein CusF
MKLHVSRAFAVDAEEMTTMSDPAPAQASGSHRVIGTVKKVDARAKTVTLDHEAVKSLNWPAMTMTFKVEDKALFKKLAADKKVEFDFVKRGSDYIVTGVK